MHFTMKCPAVTCGPACAVCKGAGEIDKYGPKPTREITEEQYWHALECLPPCKWRGGRGAESFHVSEYMSENFVNWFVNLGQRFFQIDDVDTLTHEELLHRAREYVVANPITTH